MFARVHLDRVLDNSFQTRRVYDGIEELADSIFKMRTARPETSGLIQVPPARVVLDDRVLDIGEYGGVLPCLGDEPEARVELAAGHRRFRAFQYLHIYGDGGLNSEYETFPVEIQVLDDQAMANLAWEENRRRKDLSPIEEADALKCAMERFGWTQTEIGKRWGLSQSAVANKLRLLQLPEDAQAAIRSGAITERHGRVLLKALGKTPHIYQEVALKIVPLPIEPQQAAKAREKVGDRRIFNTSRSMVNVKGRSCYVCGGEIGHPDSDMVPTFYRDNGIHLYLCLACARAAVGWESPTVAETEELTARVIRKQSRGLDSANYPLDEVVGKGDIRVQSTRCDECKYRDGETCLDEACFRAKEENWYGVMVLRFQEKARERWPDEPMPQIINEWDGRDLSKYSDTDKGMVDSGWCSPKCEHLRFRHHNHGLKPFEECPFSYNCNNTNRCNACRKRYLAFLVTDEEEAERKAAERAVAERKKAARSFLQRAESSVAQALVTGHEGAWRELAGFVSGERKAGQSVEASALIVAKRILSGPEWTRCIDWDTKVAIEAFEKVFREQLEEMGVGMMPGIDDLARKLERVQKFLLDAEGLFRTDLTEEQIRGNLDNLDRIAAEVEGIESQQDRERLLEQVWELQDLFPGK